MKRVFTFLFVVCFCFASNAQQTRGPVAVPRSNGGLSGNTYGVVVGVSHYQSAKIPQLNSADADAKIFYNFLISNEGGSRESNVKLLLNDQATCGNIWTSFDWLSRTAKKGDRVYIYFSGHGDAIDERAPILLPYDAPGMDKNLYRIQGGVIRLTDVKDVVEDIIKVNGAEVILITDACRSRELPGGGASSAYASVWSKNNGEIQFNSCSPKEVSVEDSKWGGGHGVFSWYLVKGLMGEADDNHNNSVSFMELENYVTSRVSEDRTTQNPIFTFPPSVPKAQSFVQLTSESKIHANTVFQVSTNSAIGLAFKGIFAFTDSEDSKSYEAFNNYLVKKQFVSDTGSSAWSVLHNIKLSKKIDPNTKASISEQYFAAAKTYTQSLIISYLAGGNHCASPDAFLQGAKILKTIIDSRNYFTTDYAGIKGNYFFFLARAQHESNSKSSYSYGLMCCDSAMKYMPDAAYIYNARGLMYMGLRNYKDASINFRQAEILAPNWSYPFNGEGVSLDNMGIKLLAESLFKKSLSIDSMDATTLSNLGDVYGDLSDNYAGTFDSLQLKYYKLSFKYDSTFQNPLFSLSDYYSRCQNYDLVKYYVKKAFELDSNYWNSTYRMGWYSEIKKDTVKAIYYYQKALTQKNCDSSVVLNWLGALYDKLGMKKEARKCFDRSWAINPEDRFALQGVLNSRFENDLAKIIFLDSLVNQKHIMCSAIFHEKGALQTRKDSAWNDYKKSYEINRSFENLSTILTFCSTEQDYFIHFPKYIAIADSLYSYSIDVVGYKVAYWIAVNEKDSAINILEKNRSRFPSKSQLYVDLADLYIGQNDYLASANLMEEMYSKTKQNVALYNGGMALYNAGYFESNNKYYYEAIPLSVKYSDLVPLDPDGYLIAAKCFLCIGNADSALFYLDKADTIVNNSRFLELVGSNIVQRRKMDIYYLRDLAFRFKTNKRKTIKQTREDTETLNNSSFFKYFLEGQENDNRKKRSRKASAKF